MSAAPSAPTSAGEGVLAAIQAAALALARPYDSEQATRFEAALKAVGVSLAALSGVVKP